MFGLLERIEEEEVTVYLKVILWHLLEGLGKITESHSMDSCPVWASNWSPSKHLS
jgi:hypothetical protein